MNEFGFEDSEYSYSKIPYDDKPIVRDDPGTYARRRKRVSEQAKASGRAGKTLTVIVAILLVVQIVFGGLLSRLFVIANTPKVVSNSNISISTDGSGESWAAATKAKLSAVCVGAKPKTSGEVTYSNFFEMKSSGAGVIIDLDKEGGNVTITTCYHVVSIDTTKIYVLLYGSYTPIKATLVGYSSEYDIAVLKITNNNEVRGSVCMKADIANSAEVCEGDSVIAIGNPLANGFSVTSGIISAPVKNIYVEDNPNEMRVMQLDAAINPGNSGGGLFNRRGELVGIVNAKSMDRLVYSNGSYSIDSKEGTSFAIPSNIAVGLSRNIVRNDGNPIAVTIGLAFNVGTSQDSLDAESGRLVSVVTYVTKTQSAVNAGCKDNDVVINFSYVFGGQTVVVNVTSAYDFDDHKFNIEDGSIVTFSVLQNNIPKTFQLTATAISVS